MIIMTMEAQTKGQDIYFSSKQALGRLKHICMCVCACAHVCTVCVWM